MSWHGRHACWLWPCGHCSRRLQGEGRVWHRCLTIQRAAAKLFTKAASELVSMVCRRVWRLSASLHRHRARTRLWCNGDRMAKRRRVTAKPRVSNMGTFWAKPRFTLDDTMGSLHRDFSRPIRFRVRLRWLPDVVRPRWATCNPPSRLPRPRPAASMRRHTELWPTRIHESSTIRYAARSKRCHACRLRFEPGVATGS